jgi:hypothetical protein
VNASGGAGARASGGEPDGSGGEPMGARDGTGGETNAAGSAGTPNGGTSQLGGMGGMGGADEEPYVPPDCDAFNVAGTWENITPPEVTLACLNPQSSCGGNEGVHRFALDPNNPGTVYLGTSNQGVWKTTNCGSTWVMINTGTNGITVGGGDHWTFLIDPVDSENLFVRSGDSLYKSTDGGVGWSKIWSSGEPNQSFAYTFVDLDPGDPAHLLLSPRDDCGSPYVASCYAESTDGGDTWTVVEVNGAWAGSGGGRLMFTTSTNWAFVSSAHGFWVSTNSGDSWGKLHDALAADRPFAAMYHADNGAHYFGVEGDQVGGGAVYKSADDGVTWARIPGSGQMVGGLSGDGTNLYRTDFSVCGPWGEGANLYRSATEVDDATWTNFDQAPEINVSASQLDFDRDHHLLYSSNCRNGFWRYRTE